MPKVVAVFLLLLAGCAVAPRVAPTPAEIGYRERGVASWYGKDFQGRKTSSGEVFDMYGLTAAHRTLPLGTLLQVKSEQTGKSVRVRVNDRGPFVSGRILDLSYGAAREIGMLGTGTAVVVLEVLGVEAASGRAAGPLPPFTLQVGAFEDYGNASRLQKDLEERFHLAGTIQTRETNRQRFFRVRVGRFSNEKEARKMAKILSESVRLMPFITRAD